MALPTSNLCLVVSLADFITCLKGMRYGAKLGKRNIAQEDVEFDFDGKNLLVTVVGVKHTIPANGSWKGKVAVALPIMGKLRKVPPNQNPLTISYENSKLAIGSTKVPAKLLP